VVNPTDPITTTLTPENTLALQTILTIMVWTAAPQPGMELLSEEQQARAHAQQITAERRMDEHHDERADEQQP
jgi:hypothetical protein